MTRLVALTPPPHDGPPRVLHLTPSQLRVVAELARDGADNAEIGRRLHLSPETVKTHLGAAMRQTGAVTRTELAVGLLRQRWVVCDSGRTDGRTARTTGEGRTTDAS